MSQVIDNLIALRVLTMLVKPFSETDAFKLGIIDKKGKNLIKPSFFTTSEQRNAYTFLHRLVFNMKKIINKLPGGENKLKSLVTAYFLIKEYYEKNDRTTSMMEQRFHTLMGMGVYFAEETILLEKFIKSIEEDGGAGGGGVSGGGGAGAAPANATGVMTSTDAATTPLLKKKDIDKYKKTNQGAVSMARRNNKVF